MTILKVSLGQEENLGNYSDYGIDPQTLHSLPYPARTKWAFLSERIGYVFPMIAKLLAVYKVMDQGYHLK